MQMDKNERLVLPKNIRQMGTFGDTYRVYVEDFVYTYVHQFLHQRKKEEAVLAAVLLGKTTSQDGQEYIFINGAQKVDAEFVEMLQSRQVSEGEAPGEDEPRQEFWNRVYQRIKESFDDCEILGWYLNRDGSGLEVDSKLQQFFESTYRKGSRFLYYEDSVEKLDAFFVQEQHHLQRLGGYAVYYEKNPQMQEFMVAERERLTPKPLRDSYRKTERDEVVENYRAIMNKLNEKPAKKKWQPAVYLAGAAVLAVVAAMGASQFGNYQNLKALEQTMQTLSQAADPAGKDALSEEAGEESAKESGKSEEGTEVSAAGTAAESVSDGTFPESTESASGDMQTSADAESASDGTQTVADGGSAQTTAASGNQSVGDDSLSEETAETSSSAGYYIVKKGDSLVSISKKLYGTDEKVEDICDLNSIENMDMIYEGQKLLLP